MIRVFKKFKDLLDINSAWPTSAGKFWRTKADLSGLEAVDISVTGGGSVSSVNGETPDINGNVELALDFAPALTTDENYVTDAEKAALHAPGSDNQDLSGLADINHNHALNDLTEKSYNSLTDKPTIPTQYTDEMAQDAAVALIQTGDDHLTIVHNDNANTLTLTVIPTVCHPPTGVEFGSASQQYDVSGSTLVSAVAGGTLGGVPASSAGNTLADCLAAVSISRDGTYLRVQELAGAASATNPLSVQFLFSGVTAFSTIESRSFYSGSIAHNVDIQLWNFVTSLWDTYATFSGETGYTSRNIQVFNDSLYIDNGVVKLQFIHLSTGNTTHYIDFDYIELCDGGGGSGGASIASAVTVNASGFSGNLATTDTNMQLVAQKVDQLAFAGSEIALTAPDGNGNLPITVDNAQKLLDALNDLMTLVHVDQIGTVSSISLDQGIVATSSDIDGDVAYLSLSSGNVTLSVQNSIGTILAKILLSGPNIEIIGDSIDFSGVPTVTGLAIPVAGVYTPSFVMGPSLNGDSVLPVSAEVQAEIDRQIALGVSEDMILWIPKEIPDTEAPVVTTFTATTTSKNLTTAITACTATDNVLVTGYKITESSTPPLAADAGWSAVPITSYDTPSCASNSTKTLYPWAKDAAGNVSAVFATPVTVTFMSYTVTDDFNRANGNLTTPWVAVTGGGAVPTVISNKVSRTTSGDNFGIYNSAINAYQFAQLDSIVWPTGGDGIAGVTSRAQSSAVLGYEYDAYVSSGVKYLRLLRRSATAVTLYSAAGANPSITGIRMEVRDVSANVTEIILYKELTGVWSKETTITDTGTTIVNGFGGIRIQSVTNSTVSCDNFTCGSM